MNTFITIAILALAMFATCQAGSLQTSMDFCNDDQQMSAADIAYLKANRLDNPSKDVKYWTGCYYQGQLNIFARQHDVSENLCTRSFLTHYPLKAWNGMATIANCNAEAAKQKAYDDQTWTFHVCLVNAGFKL